MTNFWKKNLNIVLVEPEIPGNTGTIGRLCVGLDASLTLIEPLGFSLEDKYLRRAGLDYWPDLAFRVLPSWDTFREEMITLGLQDRMYYCSTKAKKTHSDISYQRGDFLIFGKETKGLPEPLIFSNMDRALRIPMTQKIRSLNLALAVGIVAHEAIRQIGVKL